ncbi:Phospholipid hydroperoxide glutathione [Globisporangium polare]
MQDQSQAPITMPPPVLIGTIFARQQLFETLPIELQEDTMQFRAYVETDKRWLFRRHHHALVKSVYSVKGCELIDTIIHWLQTRIVAAQHARTSAVADLDAADQQPRRESLHRGATFPASSNATHQGTKEELECARRIAEALVLSGFITPLKDDEKHLTSNAPGHYVHENELLIPVAASVSEIKTTTVWSVLDGVVYARSMKSRAGMMGKITDGKNVYVVFNGKTNHLYVFATDLATRALAELSGHTLDVAFDNSRFEFGVRVEHRSGLEKEKPQYFNAETKTVQLEFLLACIGIGANYAEGNVKNLIEMEKAGVVVRGAGQRDSYTRLGMPTELHEADGIANATVSDREPENNRSTLQNAANAPTSSGNQYQPVGSYQTSSNQQDHLLSGPSGAQSQETGGSYPKTGKQDEYPVEAFSHPAAAS